MRNIIIFVAAMALLGVGGCGAQVSFEMSQHGSPVDTAIWHVNPPDDTISLGATYTMPLSDMITLTNNCFVPIGFGLVFNGAFDSHGSPISWIPAYIFGYDTLVLRARFELLPMVPYFYIPVQDFLPYCGNYDSIWATSIRFGPTGDSLFPDSSNYLFLQFFSPTSTSVYGCFYIVLGIFAGETGLHSASIGKNILIFVCLPDTAGIMDKKRPENLSLSAFPNPFNSSCAISAPAGAEVKVWDLRGNLVCSLTPLGGAERPSPAERERVNPSFSLAEGEGGSSQTSRMREIIWSPDALLPSGIYLVKATTQDGRTIGKRIVYIR